MSFNVIVVVACVAFVIWKFLPTIVSTVQAKVPAAVDPNSDLHTMLDALILIHDKADASLKAEVQTLMAKILTTTPVK